MKLPLLLTLLAALGPLPAQTPVPAKNRMVVVISLDGFPAYAFDDPKLPAPTLRKLIGEGAWAKRMTTVNPSVTWPNHTSIVTGVLPGEHGLFYNGTLTASGTPPVHKVEPWIEKEKMVHAVTVYDQAQKAGLTTAQVDWVAIHKAKTITWAFEEVPSVDGVVEKEMIAKGLVTAQEVEQFRQTNIFRRDQIWADAASYIIREHKPNLMLFHMLSLDSTHHTYGPKTLAGTAAIAFLDGQVARILEAIRSAGMTDRTTVIVVSDHGFKKYSKQIRLLPALAAAGISSGVQVIPEGGTAMIYLDPARAAELAPKVREAIAGVEGVTQVAGPKEFPSLGFPDPAKDPQMADLVAAARDGYAFTNTPGGAASTEVPQIGGSHGFLNSEEDMDAICIASGYGIKKGVTIDRIRNLDVASTIANLLGVKLPDAKGRVVSEFLQ
ncbi:alkaline phosphatase family protein [uncultured Paludibaculum sp.]|uniref:alkaline phosphatase family protein n=1 Tax=uncultured Paludibaculum sp. TaxID=1765020 RepID=UPI002AAAC09E|nr:alkaline phosphatase family protein [uncultured Paludibaculum sp.]